MWSGHVKCSAVACASTPKLGGSVGILLQENSGILYSRRLLLVALETRTSFNKTLLSSKMQKFTAQFTAIKWDKEAETLIARTPHISS